MADLLRASLGTQHAGPFSEPDSRADAHMIIVPQAIHG